MQLVPITYISHNSLYIVFFLHSLNQTLMLIEFIYLDLQMCLSDFFLNINIFFSISIYVKVKRGGKNPDGPFFSPSKEIDDSP